MLGSLITAGHWTDRLLETASKSYRIKTRFPSFSWPSRLCSHEGGGVGEELSGHWIDKASKVACLGRLGGEPLREFADGGFHGASDPPQAGERVGIAGIGHVLAQQRLEIDGVGCRLGLQLLGDEALVADQQATDLVVEVGNPLPFIDIGR